MLIIMLVGLAVLMTIGGILGARIGADIERKDWDNNVKPRLDAELKAIKERR